MIYLFTMTFFTQDKILPVADVIILFLNTKRTNLFSYSTCPFICK